MMGCRNLIILAFMATHAVDAFYPREYFELARIPKLVDSDSAENVLVDALADEIQSEISHDVETGKKEKSVSDMEASESRNYQGVWLDRGSETSSVILDPDENDVLKSRVSPYPYKRDEYYEGLEKKSQRSTYVPPPRKNFYTSPEILDGNISEEYVLEPIQHGRPRRISDLDGYYPKGDDLFDVLQAESHHKVDSLDVAPSKEMHNSQPLQSPAWRFSRGKSYQRKEALLATENERSNYPEEPINIPLGVASKSLRTFEMGSRRKPSARYMSSIHHHDESRFKHLSKTKPWVTDYIKAPIAPKVAISEDSEFRYQSNPWVNSYANSPVVPPKLAPKEDHEFLSPASVRRGTREQFHEQGTHGPHSYKFGYSTGDVNNPMARYEERNADGIVRGSYSYVDPRGHKQVVHYESHPKFGFKTKLSSDIIY